MYNKNLFAAYCLVMIVLVVIFSGIGCTTKKDESGGLTLQKIGGVDETQTVPTYNEPSQNLATAKKYFAEGDYDKAIAAFQKVLITNPNQEEMAIAYAGIGWSKVKKSGIITDGKNDFKSAYAAKATVQDAKVGLAAAYLLEDQSKIKEAITLLESIGRNSNDSTLFDHNFKYVSEIGTGISNAKVHALLAVLYYYNNQDAEAKKQLSIASTESKDDVRITSIETAIMTLGF